MTSTTRRTGDAPLNLYRARTAVEPGRIPSAAPVDHTMAHDLDRYVRQRLPIGPLRSALCHHLPVEVHGIHPAHLAAMSAVTGLRNVRPLGASEQIGKTLNSVRPWWFTATDPAGAERLVLAVPPGRDYVLHYASLVCHLVRRETTHVDEVLRVWRYPDAERGIAEWTGLDAQVLGDAEVVVFGKIELLLPALARAGIAVSARVTPHYSSWAFTVGGRRVCLLGVHFSYWGCIGGRLAERCCDLGATEILYLGKLGALTSPADVYRRLFVPSRFAVLDRLAVTTVTRGPRNAMLAALPTLDSGLHVSVATVLEENHAQRAVAVALGARTIDNELARMAVAIEGWNLRRRADVAFAGLHYATDYLRGVDEVRRFVPFSLARGRTPEARRRRRAAERLVGETVIDYLGITRTTLAQVS